MKKSLCVLAVVSSILLAPFASCAAEQLERSTLISHPETGHESSARIGGIWGSKEVRSEPQAYLVPVAHLTSTVDNVTMRELSRDRDLAVPRELRGPLAKLLDGPDLKPFDSAGAVIDHVSKSPKALGLVPWKEVDARVKVLAVDGKAPLRSGPAAPKDYPLKLGDASGPAPEKLHRLVLAGDVVLDRGLPYAVFQQDLGMSFPLDGGDAAITRRKSVPSMYSEFGTIHKFRAKRRGGSGEMREYLRSADLTLANLENPVLRNATWHDSGTTFNGDLRLLPLLEDAGIDGVTLANNHTLDANAPGLQETMENLDRAGISHAGGGMDLTSAREPMIFNLGDTKVGVLSYQNVPSYEWAWATEDTAGTAPLQANILREDVQRLKRRVDVVVVMPHWGEEYTATPEPGQVDLAHQALDAGADLVVGGHAHWPKGMEIYRDKPIFYGVGNFLFDQDWSEETSTGIFAEITLYEDRIIQVRPVPFVVLDNAQPNFLLPEAGGDRALNTIFSTSLGPELKAYEGSTPVSSE